MTDKELIEKGEKQGRLYVSEVRKIMSRNAARREIFLLKKIKTELIKRNVSARIIRDVIDTLLFTQDEDSECVKIDKTIFYEKENRAPTGCI